MSCWKCDASSHSDDSNDDCIYNLKERIIELQRELIELREMFERFEESIEDRKLRWVK